ncbi:MAG: hypothetical protein H7289_04740 [Mucilaginibacter sp.]|nr:hypothetical protein [Mucilaginibacter sp.]
MRLPIIVAFLFCCLIATAQVKFNGNMEVLDDKGLPAGWDLTFDHQNTYDVKLDSLEKRQRKYSLSISPGKSKVSYGAINFPIKTHLHGKTLMLVAAIKTENVNSGWAGLWLRVDGQNQSILAFDNMEKSGIKGTNPWKEYMVQVPYDEGEAVTINAGALLVGNGKIWLDSVRLYLDGLPVDKAPIRTEPGYRALTDTAYSKTSGIKTIAPTKQNINNLTLLGQLWGFLKYHHPAIAKGDYNWDAELFRVLPIVLNSHSDKQTSSVMEKWVDGLGKPRPCNNCIPITKIKDIACLPNYGELFNNTVFTKSLIQKLKYIRDNNNISESYYIGSLGDGGIVPQFRHEKGYDAFESLDAGYRLLALYRYWNIIQYFSPNRGLITEGWNNILTQYIPEVIRADTKLTYIKTIVKLISATHDTHAFITNDFYDVYLGKRRLPVQARFVQGKLVVTGYYKDTLNVKQNFKLGDVITSINKIPVTQLVKKHLPVSSASNVGAAFRDMPGIYLLRGKDSVFTLTVLRNNKRLTVKQKAINLGQANFYNIDWGIDSKQPGFKRISNNQIGYVFPGRYKDNEFESLKKLFSGTKGIVVDLRCYPSADMVENFGNFIKSGYTDFVKFSHTSVNHPGLFVYSAGSKVGSKSASYYKGKVVVIVNAQTQSNAEFVTMAFQTAPNVTVIGSPTAGADGNITIINLPLISTYESGIGVYYPNSTNTQRAGVKIDHLITPTIKGIKEGRDELLEKATEMILKNK